MNASINRSKLESAALATVMLISASGNCQEEKVADFSPITNLIPHLGEPKYKAILDLLPSSNIDRDATPIEACFGGSFDDVSFLMSIFESGGSSSAAEDKRYLCELIVQRANKKEAFVTRKPILCAIGKNYTFVEFLTLCKKFLLRVNHSRADFEISHSNSYFFCQSLQLCGQASGLIEEGSTGEAFIRIWRILMQGALDEEPHIYWSGSEAFRLFEQLNSSSSLGDDPVSINFHSYLLDGDREVKSENLISIKGQFGFLAE